MSAGRYAGRAKLSGLVHCVAANYSGLLELIGLLQCGITVRRTYANIWLQCSIGYFVCYFGCALH